MARVRKSVAFLLVAILVLATASVAIGRHTKGIYRTKPPANRITFLDLSFTATKSKLKRVRYSYRVSGGCSDGTPPIGDETFYSISPASINAAGRFMINEVNPGGSTLKIAGKITGRRASGTFRIVFDNPGVHCDTKTRHWKAYHLLG
jgi:hypothetical protein